jgi:maltodextrin utilization protein YvdJ
MTMQPQHHAVPTYTQVPSPTIIQPNIERHQLGLAAELTAPVVHHQPQQQTSTVESFVQYQHTSPAENVSAEDQLSQFLEQHEDLQGLEQLTATQGLAQIPPAQITDLLPTTSTSSTAAPIIDPDTSSFVDTTGTETDFLEELFAWEGIPCT